MDYQKKIEAIYSENKGRGYQSQVHDFDAEAFKYVAKLRAKKFQNYIDSSDRVLEYGIGPGWNLAYIKAAIKAGYDLSAVAERLKDYGIVIVNGGDELINGHYDKIICSHVLEHVADPAKILSHMRSLLGRDGELLLVVPYEKERIFRKYRRGEPNRHIYSWNVQTLSALVEMVGYQVIQSGLKKTGYERFLAVLASRFHLPQWAYSGSVKLAHIIKPHYEIFIIARKLDE